MVGRYLQINRLRIMRRGHTAYDQNFHPGVNIIWTCRGLMPLL